MKTNAADNTQSFASHCSHHTWIAGSVSVGRQLAAEIRSLHERLGFRKRRGLGSNVGAPFAPRISLHAFRS